MAEFVLRDKRLRGLPRLLTIIDEENKRQLREWGIQCRSPFEWLTYLVEEVGELAEAISESYYRDKNKISIRNEAIQAATLALKIAEMIDDIIKKEDAA